MPARPPLPPGPFLVVGLARSGVAVARALHARGETVVGCDSGAVPAERLELGTALGVAVHAPSQGTELLNGIGSVIKSPGVPKEAAVIAAARAAGIVVIGELEFGWRLAPNDTIAVTGSNGKTTTAELIGHVHREAGIPVAVVGNVGTALSSLAGGTLDPATVVVCEASSFQLEDTERFAPDAAVLLNLAEDHLDRHGSFDAYRDAKLRIFEHQAADAVAVLPDDLDVAVGGAARQVRFGAGPKAQLADRGGTLHWGHERLTGVDELALRGHHNRLNAMAAAAVCLARGLDPAAVRAGLASFGGVKHRLEEVASIDGVLYVNDSKATNVASALVGIASFDGGVHVILGGSAKGSDYRPLAGPVAERCAGAYLIGETAPQIAQALAGTGVTLTRSGDLEHALAAATAAARPGQVVLLSPACASFDQYRSYEERGDRFRALVQGADPERRSHA